MKKIFIVLISALSFLCSLFLPLSDAFGREIPLVLKAAWPQEGEGGDIAVSCAVGEDGLNSLSFRDVTTDKDIKVKYLAPDESGDIQYLYVSGMQSFNGLFVVTLETATSFLVKVFVYDRKNKIVNQLISDGARLQPELMYFGDSDRPAIGLPRLSNDSRLEQRIICGETIYVFDESENRFDIVRSKRLFHGKKKGEYPSDLSCED